jgi:hypothetical protein
MATNYAELEQVRFELPDAFTWGVKKDRYRGYTIPVVLDDEAVGKIKGLAKKHGIKNPLYLRTLYLRANNLSGKQMSELCDKGRNHIEVHFVLNVSHASTPEYEGHLNFDVTKLRKIEKPEKPEKPESVSCPED